MGTALLPLAVLPAPRFVLSKHYPAPPVPSLPVEEPLPVVTACGCVLLCAHVCVQRVHILVCEGGFQDPTSQDAKPAATHVPSMKCGDCVSV